MKKFFNLYNLSSAQILSLGYSTVILLGALLLTLPIATTNGQGMNFLDAVFTATSATAVTGLIVENTASFFTTFGQVVIMCLIQIGGLGIMSMSTLFVFLVGKRVTLKHRLMIQDDLDQFELSGILQLVKYVIAVTFTIEGTGALLLFTRFIQDMPLGKAIYFAIFHSVSAFNNAGFDIFGNSLENFTGDITVNLTITSLIILGGIGFAVIAEIYDGKKFKNFSLQTKLVLSVTAILIVVGMIGAFILEHSNPATLGKLPLGDKLLASYFLSVTPRTAGFNTVPTGALRSSTIFFVIILMFIGASPGSTGGGIKTTTFGALLAVLYSRVTGKDDIEVYKRRLDKEVIFDALSICLIALTIVALVTTILTITEKAPFLDLLFETVSAFGTVGLSTGVTGNLSVIGRVLIILTMFAGRVGPLTLAVAVAEKRHKANIRYPEEKILVG
ncbi:potassium uptake protein, TrkH family [Halobacteroides halobius DSM 5150]|uniref:Potassium uptake protein, TrkH family n=1 Tax=Halobacteroides halobius (strain ATCC 35273 / DSM 5150 / MD-1) TaxID=748449 RepID=L0KD20_HALHC|nr:TrkH family potassium uptake protein [Halobacteroides halobius]AGB41978.1 potassium uptake protein, TrkH family [Halobacteroides halobius DSM 5150]